MLYRFLLGYVGDLVVVSVCDGMLFVCYLVSLLFGGLLLFAVYSFTLVVVRVLLVGFVVVDCCWVLFVWGIDLLVFVVMTVACGFRLVFRFAVFCLFVMFACLGLCVCVWVFGVCGCLVLVMFVFVSCLVCVYVSMQL